MIEIDCISAACCHRQTAAEILISKGADRTLRNCDGQTPSEACDDPTLQAILTPS
uniref:ANK_REP_REGION domain-containing protein n=1 Tax=Angiostrongylus cantonensis TaxID=6313 RepID=A0A0K0DNT1_ANGCA